MKTFYTLLLALLPLCLCAQDDDFGKRYDALMDLLQKEDWASAAPLSAQMLADISGKTDMEKLESVLRYIVIYCDAGLMNDGKMSKEDALKAVKKFIGQTLSMPAHLFQPKSYINSTYLDDQKPNTLFSAVNNADGTQAFSFEYVTMKNPVDAASMKQYEGKMVALSGTLRSAEVAGHMLPHFLLGFDNGKMEIYEEN